MDKTYPIDINSLFIKTVERNASDLHLVPGVPPYIRVDDKLEPLDMPVIAPEVLKDLIYSILTEQQIKTLEKELEYKKEKLKESIYVLKEHSIEYYFVENKFLSEFASKVKSV